jgi:ribosomal protein S18 acetylase RimI-like enzyme
MSSTSSSSPSSSSKTATTTTVAAAAAGTTAAVIGACLWYYYKARRRRLPAPALQYRQATEADVPRLYELEAQCYPADEAASQDQVRMRMAEAGEVFMVAVEQDEGASSQSSSDSDSGSGRIIAFVNGTQTGLEQLSHDSMSQHERGGQYLCIHSVTVAPQFRRRGVGLAMLRHYVHWVRGKSQVNRSLSSSPPPLPITRLLLLSHAYLDGFYTSAGFTRIGVSAVVHGSEVWYDYGLTL